VLIGKFDTLATYTYAKALLNRLGEEEAKQWGMIAAGIGAQARLGIRKEHHEEFRAQMEAATGDPERVRDVVWPLHVRVRRVNPVC
jgi:hypothetical protein